MDSDTLISEIHVGERFRKDLGDILGGYETWLGTNRLEVQASDKMLAALLEMAAELKTNSQK